MKQDEKLKYLKNILLEEDRYIIDILKSKTELLDTTALRKVDLEDHVNRIVDEKLEQYTLKLPDKIDINIAEELSKGVKISQENIIDALFPIIGKMIMKYIKTEFKLLSDKIDEKLKKSFSFKMFSRKIKAKVSGVEEESLLINELSKTRIQEIFIIKKHSGIMLANFSKTNTIDKYVLSGMLTAIKSFVEDAFDTGNEDLESIEYGLYNIHIQNFNSFYIAVVLHGVFNNAYKGKLEYELLNFAENHLDDKNDSEKISNKLAEFFKNDII